MLFLGDEPDFKKRRPEFPGDKQSFIFFVIHNAIQDRLVILQVLLLAQAAKIDPSFNVPISRIDYGNAVGFVYIGIDPAGDIFEFVEMIDFLIVVLDSYPPFLDQGLRVEKIQFCCAVAGNKVLVVMG